jgi:hypothetical protein
MKSNNHSIFVIIILNVRRWTSRHQCKDRIWMQYHWIHVKTNRNQQQNSFSTPFELVFHLQLPKFARPYFRCINQNTFRYFRWRSLRSPKLSKPGHTCWQVAHQCNLDASPYLWTPFARNCH